MIFGIYIYKYHWEFISIFWIINYLSRYKNSKFVSHDTLKKIKIRLYVFGHFSIRFHIPGLTHRTLILNDFPLRNISEMNWDLTIIFDKIEKRVIFYIVNLSTVPLNFWFSKNLVFLSFSNNRKLKNILGILFMV